MFYGFLKEISNTTNIDEDEIENGTEEAKETSTFSKMIPCLDYQK